MPTGSSHKAKLSSSSLILTSPWAASSGSAPPGDKKGQEGLGGKGGATTGTSKGRDSGRADGEHTGGNLSTSSALNPSSEAGKRSGREYVCWEGQGGRAGQRPAKQLLSTQPKPGKRLSSIPRAKRHRSQGRGCVDPPRVPAPPWHREHRPCSDGDVPAPFSGGKEEG